MAASKPAPRSAPQQAPARAAGARDPAGHLPLAEYGVISDGRTIALVGTDASIDWWCVPAPSSPPVFDRILDPSEAAGRFQIAPIDPFTVTRRYRQGSNVLETTFTTASGSVRITDSLNSGHAGRLPWSELARRVEGLSGEVELRADLRFGSRFGESEPLGAVVASDGAFQVGPLLAQLRTTDDCALAAQGGDQSALVIHAAQGSRSTLALVVTDAQPLMDASIEDIDVRIDRSDRQWKAWSDDLRYDGAHRERVLRSALALKLLLYSPTGAIAAAATTSLPERIAGGKNWDYRYAWVRDVSYSVKALLRIGGLEEAQAGFAWMIETIDRHGASDLRPFYTLDGELADGLQEMPLPGYAGSSPVVRGNDARDQLQLGSYGDVLETAQLFTSQGNHLDERTARVLTTLAVRCAEQWREPDAGLWELEEPRQYTMSKIGCWLALDRAAALAEGGHLADAAAAARWRTQAAEIVAWIDEHCWSQERQAYLMAAGSDDLDAALLLATRFGFPRMDRLDATRIAIQAELATGPLVHRYSGMQEEEGAFLATSFWLVEALAFCGHHEDAARTMEALLDLTGGDLGLMSEMVDVDSHAFLGNLPQGLSHLAMIHAALSLQETTG